MSISRVRQKSGPGHQIASIYAASKPVWRNFAKRSDFLDRIYYRRNFVLDKLSNFIISDSGCWEYQGGLAPNGYGRFQICLRGGSPIKRTVAAHRVAYAYNFGVDPGDKYVCHRCDNPVCICPAHLFLGTPKQNSDDMVKKGRSMDQSGANNHACKLDEDIVLAVVRLITKGWSNKRIAELLPVSHSQVSHIRLGKSWRHVTEAANYDPDEWRVFKRKSA